MLYYRTKKEKEEKKRKKEESTSYDPKFQQQLRKQDKKRDDVEVEGQGLTLFEDEEVNDDQKPTYAGHVVAVVERQAGQLFAGTLGILRPSSAATKEKQGEQIFLHTSPLDKICFVVRTADARVAILFPLLYFSYFRC